MATENKLSYTMNEKNCKMRNNIIFQPKQTSGESSKDHYKTGPLLEVGINFLWVNKKI